MAGSPPARPAARFPLPLLAVLLVGLAGLPVAGGEEAAAAEVETTKVLWMETERAFGQQMRPKRRRPYCLVGVVCKKSRCCHLQLGARKWKPRRAAFWRYPRACASLRKQLMPYVQNRLCHRALAWRKSFAREWPTALVLRDPGLQPWPKWHPAHYSKARNRRWWSSGPHRYPRMALDRRHRRLGDNAPLSATPILHLEGTETFRPLGPIKGPLPNIVPSSGYTSRPSHPSETGATPPARCQCPGGESSKGEDGQQKALKGPQTGRRVPTPRTEEAAWAASALTFLLVVLTVAVLYTQLHRKCRRGRSLYWPTGSEEGHDTVAAVVKRRLLSAQARRKKRPRKQPQRMPLLPATSSESSE